MHPSDKASPTISRLHVPHTAAAIGGSHSSPSSPVVRTRGRTAAAEEVRLLEDMERPRHDAKYTSVPSGEEGKESNKNHSGHSLDWHNHQKMAYATWILGCVASITYALNASSEEHYELFYIYYQPLLPMLAMLWLWGIVVRFFERHSVKYHVCFSPRDQKFLLSSRAIFQASSLVTILVLTSAAAFTFHCLAGQLWLAGLHPPSIYCAIAFLLLFPGNFLFRDSRLFFSATLWKVCTPVREVTWADFLLADILTSLAKSLSDAERAVCLISFGPVMQPHSTLQRCGSSSMVIPLGLCLPYAWRLFQCIRVYTDTGAKPQLLNALKYSTAFPVIILSSIKYHVPIESWHGFYKPLWLAAAFINSGYSYFWDIERDWDIQWFSSPGTRCFGKPHFKADLLYPHGFYYWLMASNAALRLSWTYKLSPHLRRNQVTVMCFVMLEVLRRFQWMFVRIEVELRKLQVSQPELGRLVPPVPASPRKASKDVDLA